MPTMLIYVTKNDIKSGQRKSAFDCPIALALKWRGFAVWVRRRTVSFYPHFVEVDLPPAARAFLERFDSGVRRGRLKPFQFHLTVPKEIVS